MRKLKHLFFELRPLQWVKNGFVLLPLFFSGQAARLTPALLAVAAAAIFSAVASSMYVFNDILDREDDRRHPVKRNRPIAAGILPVGLAAAVATVLLGGGVVAAFLLNREFGLVIVGYALLTMLYSAKLKHVIVFDTMVIVLGFLLRTFGGGLAINVTVSEWLFITVAFLALFLAVLKRYAEFATTEEGNRRAVLESYNPEIIRLLTGVGLTGTLISYSLYIFSRSDHSITRWTILLVMFAMFRYLVLALRDGRGGEPERSIFRDSLLFLSIVAVIAVLIFVMYV